MTAKENINRVLLVFDRLSKVFASLEGFAGDISLGKLDLLALDAISREDELTMGKLAKGLGTRLSTATGIVDRLIEKKLVKRERNHGDRRVVRVTVTERGKRIALAHQKQKKEAIEKMMKVLSAKEQEDFILIWEKIADTLPE